jgi:CRISPR type III-A-associated RAMP protein Csm4
MVISLPSIEVSEKEDIEAVKNLKRTRYLPSEVFSKLSKGDLSQEELFEAYKGEVSIDGEDYRLSSGFLLPDGDREPYSAYETPGISVNRLTSSTDGALFHRRGVKFSEDSGLYLLADGETGYVNRALSAMQDEGIGGGSSVGKGHYSFEGPADVTPDIEVGSDSSFCTLSLCVPSDDEIKDFFEQGYYRTKTRKGLVENSFTSPENVWKRKVLAISEGSVLPSVSEDRHGHNPVVADHFENGVQHYGYAFPVKLEGESGRVA